MFVCDGFKGFKFVVCICYDGMFLEFVWEVVYKGVNVYIWILGYLI